MNHNANNHKSINQQVEYLKFASVLLIISLISLWHANINGLDSLSYLESFMGVFFLVFAGFKLYNLKEFAYGFQSYEIMKNKSVVYGYIFPFIQVIFGLLYLFGYSSILLNGVVFLWSASNTYIVYLTIRKKGDIHCVCLGNVIKLPLSTISFAEDFGMAVMALIMLVFL